MDPVPFPAVRPFEVWYVPEDDEILPERVPLRVGQRLLHYDESVDLANAVARELPSYGLHQGLVLVVWSSSGLKVLNTICVPPSEIETGTRWITTVSGAPHTETVRLVLEDLRQLTGRSNSAAIAPDAWIERLHAVLRVIAGPEDQMRFRLDGMQGITMELLHRRVSGVLYLADRLASETDTRDRRMARIVPLTRDSG